jgi:PAS domain S-box-containing protein
MWAKVTASPISNDAGEILYVLRIVEDITSQREAESQLLASERRYRLLFESAPMGIAVSTREKSIAQVNPAFLTMFGRDEIDIIGKRLSDFRDPGADETDFNLNIRDRLRAGEGPAITTVLPLAHGDGTPMWAKITASVILDENGELLHVQRIAEDITTQREAEEELIASEQRFRRFFEASPLGLAVCGPTNRIELANAALLGMFGRSEQEILGHEISEFRFPGFVVDGASSNDLMRAGAHAPQVYERSFQRADGSSMWAKVTATPISDEIDGRMRILRSIDDITDEKVAADQLLASEVRFRSLFDSTPVGIAIVDANAIITALNPALSRLLGYSPEEILGKTLLHFRSPSDRGTGQHRTLGLAHNSTSEVSTERLMVRKNESQIWTQVVTAPVRDEQGAFLFGVRMVVDISERKEIERMKNEFLGMVSHELRTPLTAIQAEAGLVASGALGPLPEPMQRMLDIAAENSDRLTRLVNDVLDLERMHAGRIELELMECHASVLIQQAAHAAGALAKDAGVNIETTSADAKFFADPDRIVQTLINLVANAVKFSPSGSTVAVGIEKTESGLWFNVSDHGRGIPSDEIPLIFDRFHQVQRGDSRDQGGIGQGLSISQWIVEQHEGRLWVESVLGQGSTFLFELPDR